MPGAIVLSLALAIILPSRQAADIQLDDTSFVVLHFHVTALLGAFAMVVTCVAHRYGAINTAIFIAWVLGVIHAISAVILTMRAGGVSFEEPGTVTTVVPSHSALGYLYLASALLGFAAVLVGMLASLRKALRREIRT